MKSKKLLLCFAVAIAWLVGLEPAHAYIGPGAGFAFLSGGLVLIGSLFLAIGILAIGYSYKHACNSNIDY